MTRNERWKPVVGFEGLYEVSDLGRVRSASRMVRAVSKAGREYHRWVPGRVLTVEPTGDYGRVQLCVAGTTTPARVHDLVLTAFVGPCPQGQLCRHLDGSRCNNRLGNLKWGTPKENSEDRRRHGTHLECERHPGAVLDADAARSIRRAKGVTQRILADMYGCSQSTVSLIRSGRIWHAA